MLLPKNIGRMHITVRRTSCSLGLLLADGMEQDDSTLPPTTMKKEEQKKNGAKWNAECE